jgi:N-acyl-D-aspartate/D-glutamate deacylase
MAYDLLIGNGTIVDGMGAAPFAGSVGIAGDTIVAVGPAADVDGPDLRAR